MKKAGVFRYEPRSEKPDVFVYYGFANPWGHHFERWGQKFVADASGGRSTLARPSAVMLITPTSTPG